MVQIPKSLPRCVYRANLLVTVGWHCHDPDLPPHFLTGSWAQPVVWYSCPILVQMLWRKETWKQVSSGAVALPFAQALVLGWGFCAWATNTTAVCGHVCHWPGPWLSGLTLNLFLHYGLARWSLDPLLTMVTKPNSWRWLNLRPASLLQICLATWTLGWSWLPSLDLLWLPCLGTVGLNPCWGGHCPCLPWCLLLGPCLPWCLLLAPNSFSLMEQYWP